MKKWISILLAAVLAFGLAACGSGNIPSEPKDSVYRSDVQEYVEEILDSSAEIKQCYIQDSRIDGDRLVVTCVAQFSGASGEKKGTFTLTYGAENGEWVLDKCRVALEENQDTTAAPTETETTPVETVPETTAPPETTVPPTQAAPKGNSVTLGRYENGAYINEYIGFTLPLDDTWVFYPADQLQDMPSNVADILAGSDVGDAINPLNQITDMMAESETELANINVLYQKQSLQNRLVYATMTHEDILDVTLSQSDSMIEAYAQAGIVVSSMEKVTVTFLGQETLALKTVAKTNGIDHYVLQVFDFHLGEYSVTITFSSFGQDKTEALAAMCLPIEP